VAGSPPKPGKPGAAPNPAGAAGAKLPRSMRSYSRRLRFTREGRWFTFLTVGVGFGAINTGNNLLYLLLGWMLSAIIASGILSERALRGLKVSRLPPGRVYAGRPFLMQISLQNEKKRLPSFSIEVEDLVDEKPLDKKCYFLKLPAGRLQTTRYRHTFSRRGLYQFDGFRLSTKFPFALFRKSRDLSAPGEVLVYPAVVPVKPPPPATRAGGEDPHARLGRRGEFFGLRELREGDDHRDVHWASSARMARPMVREYEEEAHRRATILVDNGLAEHATEVELDALERAISLAASLAAHYLGRQYAVRLIARGTQVAGASGQGQLHKVLRALALLETVPPETPFAGSPAPGGENLLVARRGAPPRVVPPHVSRVMEAG
jgi:uncharacterized protein (DUF58 family)